MACNTISDVVTKVVIIKVIVTNVVSTKVICNRDYRLEGNIVSVVVK